MRVSSVKRECKASPVLQLLKVSLEWWSKWMLGRGIHAELAHASPEGTLALEEQVQGNGPPNPLTISGEVLSWGLD